MSETNGHSSKEDMHAKARTYKEKTVDIGGLSFRLRSLTARDKGKIDAASVDSKGRPRIRYATETVKARMIQYAVLDDDGSQMFSANDVDRILDWDSSVTERLVDEIQQLCGWDEAEDTAKNSDTTTSGEQSCE